MCEHGETQTYPCMRLRIQPQGVKVKRETIQWQTGIRKRHDERTQFDMEKLESIWYSVTGIVLQIPVVAPDDQPTWRTPRSSLTCLRSTRDGHILEDNNGCDQKAKKWIVPLGDSESCIRSLGAVGA